METRGRFSISSLYYYITPAFILLDYVWGINVRTAVLDGMPFYKNLYYGFCILCGVVIYVWPWLSAAVAMFESIIIIVMTILGLFLPYVQYLKAADDILNTDLPMTGSFDVPHITNILLAMAIAALSFHMSIKKLEAGPESDGPPSLFED